MIMIKSKNETTDDIYSTLVRIISELDQEQIAKHNLKTSAILIIKNILIGSLIGILAISAFQSFVSTDLSQYAGLMGLSITSILTLRDFHRVNEKRLLLEHFLQNIKMSK